MTTLTITLPGLSAEQAIALCDALQETINAIWDAHGDAMAEILAREAAIESDADSCPEPPCDPEDDVPF